MVRAGAWRRARCALGRRGCRAFHLARRCVIEAKQYLFAIKDGNDVRKISGRNAAIERAKEVSARTWRPVGLERDDGRVRMQFRRGVLQTYRYDTV